jgi:D-glycero-D-manno-heptose 1,7-bisphosphate phosphatase
VGGPAVFLDRDGTVIEERHFLDAPDGVVLIEGAAAALDRFRRAGYALVLVTNQSGIGRRRFGWPEYEAVADRVRSLLGQCGLEFDAELVCGHAPGANGGCSWRKPNPGMLEVAKRRLELDLSTSIMIGDRLTDLQAAARAGVGFAGHVLTGHGLRERLAVRQWAAPIPVLELSTLASLQLPSSLLALAASN